MNTVRYMKRQLVKLARAHLKFHYGEYKWLTSDEMPPIGKVILVASESFRSYSPTLVVNEIYNSGGLEIITSKELFTEKNITWKYWSALPAIPATSTNNREFWIKTNNSRPSIDGHYLVLTKKNELLVAIIERKLHGDKFMFLVFVYTNGNISVGEYPVDAEYWAKLPEYPNLLK